MYFVRSGVIHLPYGSLQRAGYRGVIWGSVAEPQRLEAATDLFLDQLILYVSDRNVRYFGFSLCMIAFLCISSVVALSISISAQSAVQAAAVVSGLPLLFPPIMMAPSSRISLTSSTHQTCTHAMLAFPSTHFYYFSMYFVRSGYINLQFGSVWGANREGYVWSSVSYPDDLLRNAFYSYYAPSTSYPSASANRYAGLPLLV